jgi:hypothetical protein
VWFEAGGRAHVGSSKSLQAAPCTGRGPVPSLLPRYKTGSPTLFPVLGFSSRSHGWSDPDHAHFAARYRAVTPSAFFYGHRLFPTRWVASYILGECPLFLRALEARAVFREASHATCVCCLSDHVISMCVTSLGGYLMTVLYALMLASCCAIRVVLVVFADNTRCYYHVHEDCALCVRSPRPWLRPSIGCGQACCSAYA